MSDSASEKQAFYSEVMTLTEIAKHLRVSTRTILRMLETEDLPGGKIGGQWRFSRDAVDTWLTAQIGRATSEQLVQVVATKRERLTRIPDLLPPDRIIMALVPGGKADVLRQLVAPLADAGIVPNPRAYLDALTAREELLTTAIGDGVALPHAREAGDAGPREDCLVLGLSSEGIDFEALDGGLTHIFLLVGSVSITSHLRLMAKVSLMLRVPGLVHGLRTADSLDQVRQLLFEAHKDLSIRL